MNMAPTAREIAESLLVREGRLLDERDWSAWLELYTLDTVYWVPAWRDEDTQVSDPDREVSLIYHTGRWGLEERVVRIRSRQTVTALPLLRTTHFVGNVEAAFAGQESIEARANWMVQIYQPRTTRQHVHHGSCEVVLVRGEGETWRIASKTIRLVNDCVNAVLDFYLL
ncbi:MAG: aromatic-ring-hydroxylating dioxygenase subunit beta [Gammaproteobacteria bacterium]|nr:aromatic-ring-hydroxylating dioxygenase subunit beta [Gammaproteobacteria bacterium]